jgi:hypothetical protein
MRCIGEEGSLTNMLTCHKERLDKKNISNIKDNLSSSRGIISFLPYLLIRKNIL